MFNFVCFQMSKYLHIFVVILIITQLCYSATINRKNGDVPKNCEPPGKPVCAYYFYPYYYYYPVVYPYYYYYYPAYIYG